MEITENSKTLKFDANGLIPAIVQDHYTKEVLTLAYMNAETLALTIAEGRTVFWSRSRREIWRKGETSGNVQRVVSITADCDKDALVIDVVKSGPACHTGAESCFFNPVYVSDELKQFTWQGLYALIEGRKTDPKEGSYTTYLFDKGLGVYLPLITTNCCVLGVTILAVQDYSAVVAEFGFGLAYAEALICAAGAGVGFLVAMLLFCGVRSRVENSNPPESFKGLPITLVSAAITSMSFMGFGGLVENIINAIF